MFTTEPRGLLPPVWVSWGSNSLSRRARRAVRGAPARYSSRMSDPILSQVQNWLREHESDLLRDYRRLLQFPSLEAEARPNAPFGQANREALDFMLALGKEWGMRTADGEGYYGYAEFGDGEKLIMSLGHLDVVPVGDGWKHDPFGAEIDGEYVYARGAVDDKGPTMASFYAMRALQAVVPEIGARMRSVFGCNEESGFACIHKYVEREESPTFGVAPDSGWPLYHAEKGIANLEIEVTPPTGDLELVSARGGQRPNIVIDHFECTLRVAPAIRAEVEGKLSEYWDQNISSKWHDDELHLVARGKAAHGAWPFGGDSAATRMFRLLMDLAPVPQSKAYTELMEMGHVSGVGLGIHGGDDVSKDLTCNLGIVETQDGKLQMLFNIRYPVTWTGALLEQKCRAFLGELSLRADLRVTRDSKPLYFPLEHPLVQTICEVYTAETGETKAPGTMGGGTYARAVPNTVSIGTGWEGDGNAHETDERLKIENLYKMSRIYAHIFYRLAQLEA